MEDEFEIAVCHLSVLVQGRLDQQIQSHLEAAIGMWMTPKSAGRWASLKESFLGDGQVLDISRPQICSETAQCPGCCGGPWGL